MGEQQFTPVEYKCGIATVVGWRCQNQHTRAKASRRAAAAAQCYNADWIWWRAVNAWYNITSACWGGVIARPTISTELESTAEFERYNSSIGKVPDIQLLRTVF